jgi:hypothetical protein
MPILLLGVLVSGLRLVEFEGRPEQTAYKRLLYRFGTAFRSLLTEDRFISEIPG